jgi:heptosyltransferase-2
VWFTKQYPAEKWVSLIDALPERFRVYLTGGPSDDGLCESIRQGVRRPDRVETVCGRISMLATVALMEGSAMNYVNDSAALHFASAVNAPVTAIYCSTVPAFGYGPLSDNSSIVETAEPLPCRPCGTHGKSFCPEGHFRCARQITNAQLFRSLP